MRKNIASVIDAFHARETYQDKTCRTDGGVVYSYALPIAAHRGQRVVVLDPAESPSRTTTSQIRAVLAALPGSQTVSQAQMDAYLREDFHADG
jgi:hypothetical protein